MTDRVSDEWEYVNPTGNTLPPEADPTSEEITRRPKNYDEFRDARYFDEDENGNRVVTLVPLT